MITAVDTSIILDILVDDPQFASVSEAALRRAAIEGKLIVCECVVAEVFPAIQNKERFGELIDDWQLEYSAISYESALLAGHHFSVYLSRGGDAKRVLPDFLVGAHAALAADRLLARDRGYLRDYFASLSLWDPSSQGCESS